MCGQDVSGEEAGKANEGQTGKNLTYNMTEIHSACCRQEGTHAIGQATAMTFLDLFFWEIPSEKCSKEETGSVFLYLDSTNSNQGRGCQQLHRSLNGICDEMPFPKESVYTDIAQENVM